MLYNEEKTGTERFLSVAFQLKLDLLFVIE